MNLSFNLEPDKSYSVIAQDVVHEGYLHQELYWADIIPALASFMVRWNDNHQDIIHLDTLADARKHIKANYNKHTPHSNGSKYRLNEE
jgi:hypothetical protein